LREANKVGIARVVIRSREHLAALKPNGEALVLELMHFADELVAQSDFDFPELKEKVAPAELKVAKLLIDTMSVEAFEPEKFTDEYKEAVMAMIEARVAGEQVTAPEAKRPVATNVVNLMDVLQRSLEQSKRPGAASPKGAAAKAGAKKAAPAAKPKRKKSAA
jgi:DNA end-binding protein Ku